MQPRFYDWAFNRNRGKDIKKHWDLIPDNIDVLLTHGPAYGILDKTIGQNRGNKGDRADCEDLLDKIKQVKPMIHAFGHIHEDYGVDIEDDTILSMLPSKSFLYI